MLERGGRATTAPLVVRSPGAGSKLNERRQGRRNLTPRAGKHDQGRGRGGPALLTTGTSYTVTSSLLALGRDRAGDTDAKGMYVGVMVSHRRRKVLVYAIYLVTSRRGGSLQIQATQEPVPFFPSPLRRAGDRGPRETGMEDSQKRGQLVGGGVRACWRAFSTGSLSLSLSFPLFPSLFPGCYQWHAVRRQVNDSETLNASGCPKQPGMDGRCQASLSV